MNESVIQVTGPESIASACAAVASNLNNQAYESATGERLQYEIEIRPVTKKQRTPTQNNCLYLWAELCAKALNEAGYDQRKVLRQDAPIPWTKTAFVDRIWRPVQEAINGEKSTTRASTTEYSVVSETIIKHIAESQGFNLPEWPTWLTQGLQRD